MSRSKSSKQWLKEHFSDPFVKQAHQEGLRSRAAFKLRWIQEKDQLIQPGMTVVDLGAAPGGWSQVGQAWLQGRGEWIALDILPMDPLPGVYFLQGDFTEESTWQALQSAMPQTGVDVFLSDMSPNLSGHAVADQASGMLLVEMALEAAIAHLKPGGAFLTKVFQGAGFDAYLSAMRSAFTKVVTRKPPASRGRSRELYLLGRGFRGVGKTA